MLLVQGSQHSLFWGDTQAFVLFYKPLLPESLLHQLKMLWL